MNKSVLLIVILVVALAGTGYVWYAYFYAPSPADTGEVASIDGSAEPFPESIDISQINPEYQTDILPFLPLKDLVIDTSILQDPLFRQLVLLPDLLTPLVPIGDKLGKSNPFAPSAVSTPVPQPVKKTK